MNGFFKIYSMDIINRKRNIKLIVKRIKFEEKIIIENPKQITDNKLTDNILIDVLDNLSNDTKDDYYIVKNISYYYEIITLNIVKYRLLICIIIIFILLYKIYLKRYCT